MRAHRQQRPAQVSCQYIYVFYIPDISFSRIVDMKSALLANHSCSSSTTTSTSVMSINKSIYAKNMSSIISSDYGVSIIRSVVSWSPWRARHEEKGSAIQELLGVTQPNHIPLLISWQNDNLHQKISRLMT